MGEQHEEAVPDVVAVHVDRPTLWLGDLYKQGYLAGQLAMRERAAKEAERHKAALGPDYAHYQDGGQIAYDIRKLQPEEPK